MYYNLKNLSMLNQKGGEVIVTKQDEPDESFKFPIPDKKISFSTFKVDLTLYEKDYCCNLNLVKIQLDDTNTNDKPILFLTAGFSTESFMSASYVILSKLKLLQTKFSAIYILDYSSMKDAQGDVCKIRDRDKTKFDPKPENKLNKEIAISIHKILENLELSVYQKDNIHLLGKSNGGWIVTLLLKMYPNSYKGLYLAVPGIPHAVRSLKEIDFSILKGINFVFGFSQQDAYEFGFGNCSNEEKQRYDEIMREIMRENGLTINFKSYMEDNMLPPHEKMHHELYQSMIDHIILSLQ
jgi:predicted esterase